MGAANPWWVRLTPGGTVYGPVMSALRVMENGVMLGHGSPGLRGGTSPRQQGFPRGVLRAGIAFVPFPAGSGFGQANPVLSNVHLRSTANRLGHAPAQLALAWLLGLAPNVLLIPGTSSLGHLEQNVAGRCIKLDERTQAELAAATQYNTGTAAHAGRPQAAAGVGDRDHALGDALDGHGAVRRTISHTHALPGNWMACVGRWPATQAQPLHVTSRQLERIGARTRRGRSGRSAARMRR